MATVTRPMLVTGATGVHGAAVAESLMSAGCPVRAPTRNREGGGARRLREAGAEVVEGDLRLGLIGVCR